MRRIHPAPPCEIPALDALADRPPSGSRLAVRVVMVQSVDGRIAVDGRSGALSSPADHRVFLANRALADVVIVGAGTVRREGYGPSRLTPELVAARREAGRSPVPPVAVISRSLDLDLEAPLFTDASEQTLVITTNDADRRARDRVGERADLIVVDAPLDVAAACGALWARGHRTAALEGGPATIRTFLHADHVDEFCLSVTPLLVGDGPGLLPGSPPPVGLELQAVLEDDGLIVLRYARTTRTGRRSAPARTASISAETS